ncbi:hypothetical protein [Dictyobacter formicarum]|uniref:Methyl-accepting chemotaxis protein n=1 Tax=Dictyobacter formicarum TaxID=2778368 RepID=A0ABQ3VJ00_9CHLR|nr:hypothetical protein [Dictyobacter formicarum]GHO85641.1 hypothetical protein KSZ_36470 [Dictyobacter formicarum]
MIDTNHITELLTEMTRRIESFDTESAQRLKLLNNAIQDESSGEINAWADADLYQLIDPTLVLERYHGYLSLPTRSDVITSWRRPLRLLLPFLPLLLTGLSLAQALMLYPAILSTPANRGGQSFLFWWQQGFNGQLPGWLRASNVVLLDVLLLLAWLLFSLWLTIGPSRRQQEHRQVQARQEQELRASLTHMLALVTLYLAQYKSQLSTAENLTLVARRIDAMGSRLEKNFEQVTGRFDSMTRQVATQFDNQAQHMTEQFEDMTRQVSDRFTGMAQELTQGFDGVTTDVATRYDSMSQQVMHRFGQVTDRMLEQLLEGSKYLKEIGKLTAGVVKTADHVRAAATILQETNGELALQAQNLVAPTADLARQQASLITVASRSMQLLEEVSNTMADLSQKQDRWGTDLRNILDTLDLTVERAAELAFKFANKENTNS